MKDLIPKCDLCFMFKMSQTLNIVPNFDGLNYGNWKSHMRFFFKSINVWTVIKFGFKALEKPIAKLMLKNKLIWQMTKL
jgi:hypothetical protein